MLLDLEEEGSDEEKDDFELLDLPMPAPTKLNRKLSQWRAQSPTGLLRQESQRSDNTFSARKEGYTVDESFTESESKIDSSDSSEKGGEEEEDEKDQSEEDEEEEKMHLVTNQSNMMLLEEGIFPNNNAGVATL